MCTDYKFLKLSREYRGRLSVLIGHFVLVVIRTRYVKLALYVFNSLNFNEIILFIDNIENIYNRLVKRDNNSDLNLLELSRCKNERF